MGQSNRSARGRPSEPDSPSSASWRGCARSASSIGPPVRLAEVGIPEVERATRVARASIRADARGRYRRVADPVVASISPCTGRNSKAVCVTRTAGASASAGTLACTSRPGSVGTRPSQSMSRTRSRSHDTSLSRPGSNSLASRRTARRSATPLRRRRFARRPSGDRVICSWTPSNTQCPVFVDERQRPRRLRAARTSSPPRSRTRAAERASGKHDADSPAARAQLPVAPRERLVEIDVT